MKRSCDGIKPPDISRCKQQQSLAQTIRFVIARLTSDWFTLQREQVGFEALLAQLPPKFFSFLFVPCPSRYVNSFQSCKKCILMSFDNIFMVETIFWCLSRYDLECIMAQYDDHQLFLQPFTFYRLFTSSDFFGQLFGLSNLLAAFLVYKSYWFLDVPQNRCYPRTYI